MLFRLLGRRRRRGQVDRYALGYSHGWRDGWAQGHAAGHVAALEELQRDLEGLQTALERLPEDEERISTGPPPRFLLRVDDETIARARSLSQPG